MNLALEDVAELADQLNACDRSAVNVNGALRRYEAIRWSINDAVIGYGDRLARNFNDRAKLLDIFDPRTQSSARAHLIGRHTEHAHAG